MDGRGLETWNANSHHWRTSSVVLYIIVFAYGLWHSSFLAFNTKLPEMAIFTSKDFTAAKKSYLQWGSTWWSLNQDSRSIAYVTDLAWHVLVWNILHMPLQWRIQDFAEWGCAKLLFCKIFAKNLHENENVLPTPLTDLEAPLHGLKCCPVHAVFLFFLKFE